MFQVVFWLPFVLMLHRFKKKWGENTQQEVSLFTCNCLSLKWGSWTWQVWFVFRVGWSCMVLARHRSSNRQQSLPVLGSPVHCLTVSLHSSSCSYKNKCLLWLRLLEAVGIHKKNISSQILSLLVWMSWEYILRFWWLFGRGYVVGCACTGWNGFGHRQWPRGEWWVIVWLHHRHHCPASSVLRGRSAIEWPNTQQPKQM